ncbi:hypothetical protein [Govanella unica]|uniref:Uncharacterized protein n=1 Tax=Govanella unica TaxID=2975056 RepID=A0A9X3TUN9_9PROT|nr:hypothetical protein [Govania unica]MDA5192515.1 hypothetical protein [Govania unica]
MLTLKEFVKTTLSEVIEALIEFEAAENERGRNVTPFPEIHQKDVASLGFLTTSVLHTDANGNTREGSAGILERARHVVMPVEFNVAVTASSQDEASGGVGLRVVEMFRAGVDTRETSTNSSISRVCFKVPVQLATCRPKH